ncbi:unnamed protein product [Penicillium salamii]|nr:unnamed protein product [Penicillium salamii]
MSLSVEDLEATFSLATNAIHMDDRYAGADVAPAMHPSTTFRYPYNPEELEPHESLSGESLVYATGLSAIHAYLTRIGPKKVAIGGGYHGTHAVLDIHQRTTGTISVGLDELDKLEAGDVIHLETPLNPTGEARNIAAYSKVAKEKGLYLVVDSTFGPPALQDPFLWGADIVIHSGTKYIGGHSDIMCGTLATQRQDLFMGLWEDRCALGNILGSFESWLALRSLRTLDIRCERQSKNCTALVSWMTEKINDENPNAINSTVEKITHASLQTSDMHWLQRQMPNGFGPVFGLIMKNEKYAKSLPSKLRIFQHATSLGGVESLIEWRRMSDHSAEGNVLRVSVGIETLEDLQKDFLNGFMSLLEETTT